MRWIAPIWSGSAPEQSEETAAAVFGRLFMAIAISAPLGTLLTAIGVHLYADVRRQQGTAYLAVSGAHRRLMLVALSMLYPATPGYYPALFGIEEL